MITRHYSAERQTTKQTLTTSKNSIEFMCSNFPCHLKVKRDKLALINRLWKCKKGERLTINANSFTKIDQLDGFRPLFWSVLENSARSRNQSDCWICWIPPAHELKKKIIGNIGPRSFLARTSLRSLRTATTSGQYSPVSPLRSVSKRLIINFPHRAQVGEQLFTLSERPMEMKATTRN